MEGFPGAQQQRTGGRAGQLRQPRAGAHAEILRRRGSRMRQPHRLRPRDAGRIAGGEGDARTEYRELPLPRGVEGGDERGAHRQQVSGRLRAVETRQDRSRTGEDDPQHRLADHGQPLDRRRTLHALHRGQVTGDAAARTVGLGAYRGDRSRCRRSPDRDARVAFREDRGRRYPGAAR